MISTGEVGSVSAPGWVPPHGCPLRPRSTMDVSGTEVVKKYMKRKREDFEASAGAVAVAPLSETWKKVCVDCQTSITPLWRTGPSGPKSLCNACGIRYRKRKSAISEQRRYKLRIRPAITNASIIDGDVPSPADVKAEQLMRLQREKQQRLLLLLLQHQRAERSWQRRPKKRSEVAEGIICGGVGGPGKEETEAALLLMSLSSGISVRS